jgi:hypothetical protein
LKTGENNLWLPSPREFSGRANVPSHNSIAAYPIERMTS